MNIRGSKPNYSEEYYLAHKEAIDKQIAYNKTYRIKNAAKIKQRDRAYNLANSEKQKEYQKDYRKINNEMVKSKDRVRRVSLKGRLKAVKTRAVVWDREFDLDLQWAESQPMICYYSGQELTLDTHKPNTLSFERIDNSKGYTRDNTVFCSNIINIMKKAMTKDDFINLCRNIVMYHDKKR